MLLTIQHRKRGIGCVLSLVFEGVRVHVCVSDFRVADDRVEQKSDRDRGDWERPRAGTAFSTPW